jgi:hypothetical protein
MYVSEYPYRKQSAKRFLCLSNQTARLFHMLFLQCWLLSNN